MKGSQKSSEIIPDRVLLNCPTVESVEHAGQHRVHLDLGSADPIGRLVLLEPLIIGFILSVVLNTGALILVSGLVSVVAEPLSLSGMA